MPHRRRPLRPRGRLAPALAAALCAVLAAPVASAAPVDPTPAPATPPIAMFVLRQGVGSSARAQEYVDALMAVVARVNGWSSGAVGKYFTTIKPAEAYIAEAGPHYGILSLPAYLAMRAAHKLALVGTVKAAAAGGRQYFILSKAHALLADCKGKTLASNLLGDATFVDRIVSGDAFDLADFTLVETKRPVQTLKAVIRDEAACALVDDAQVAELSSIDGGDALKAVWLSPVFPAMVVAALPAAPATEVSAFRDKLDALCVGEGKAACDAAGLAALEPAEPTMLDAIVQQYGR